MNCSLKKIGLFILLSAMTCVLAVGCNTVRGVGRDVQKLGSTVERAAR
jgi:predicted small secreted protein